MLSTEETRIIRIAEVMIEEEMAFIKNELKTLRADMARSYDAQRHELKTFIDDAKTIMRRREH